MYRANQRNCGKCEEAINLLNEVSVNGSTKEDGRMCKANGKKDRKEKLITDVK